MQFEDFKVSFLTGGMDQIRLKGHSRHSYSHGGFEFATLGNAQRTQCVEVAHFACPAEWFWQLHVSNKYRPHDKSGITHITDRRLDPCYILISISTLSQSGYLDVVVPPDIVNTFEGADVISDEGSIPENGTVKLSCLAIGVPKPTVQWRREGGRDITIRAEGGLRDNKQGKETSQSFNVHTK